MINLTPDKRKQVLEPAVIVQFADGEAFWFERVIEKELMFFMSAEATSAELSALSDPKKWEKKKKRARESGRSTAADLVKMAAIRDSLYRPPCPQDDEKYRAFERAFEFQPTGSWKPLTPNVLPFYVFLILMSAIVIT